MCMKLTSNRRLLRFLSEGVDSYTLCVGLPTVGCPMMCTSCGLKTTRRLLESALREQYLVTGPAIRRLQPEMTTACQDVPQR